MPRTQLKLTLTQDELTLVDEAARRAGLNRAAWAATVVVDAAEAAVQPNPVRRLLADIIALRDQAPEGDAVPSATVRDLLLRDPYWARRLGPGVSGQRTLALLLGEHATTTPERVATPEGGQTQVFAYRWASLTDALKRINDAAVMDEGLDNPE